MRKWIAVLMAVALLVGLSAPVRAAPPADIINEGGYWKEPVDYDEAPAPYEGFTPYSQIAGILRDIETRSNRVKVEVMGQSAGGHDLFLVTVSDPAALGRLGHYQAFRQMMLRDPEKAQEMLDRGQDFKVPIFINASIHGWETTGVDAALRMLKRLAFDDDEEVQEILRNTIVLLNIVQNPDGRIMARRYNANGFDVNRDFITLSQPESRATAAAIVKWKPMIFLDLHGFVNPMLIEPCTVPHNPNYEYDLYIKWALPQAEAMRAAVRANTSYDVQIPYVDLDEGWDDYPPIFAPMYAMYHGAIGHTLETPERNQGGVDAHYYAIMAAARFAAQNKVEMFHDQIEIFKRGLERVVQPDITFPFAYVIPMDPALQKDPIQAAKAIDHLLFNGIEVEQAVRPFQAGGVTYPAGTYVVSMSQPLRALANTMLWDGEDISDRVSNMYDISAWSLPELWGFDSIAVPDAFSASLIPVSAARYPGGGVAKAAPYYVLPNNTNNAVKAVNELLREGFVVRQVTRGDENLATGTYVIPAEQKGLPHTLVALANKYHLTFAGGDASGVATKRLGVPRIAVFGDGAISFVLRQLGFDVTTVSPSDDLSEFDVLVVSSRCPESWPAVVKSFVAGGGGYIGIGRYGVAAGTDMLPLKYVYGGSDCNGIVMASYDPSNLIASYYRESDCAFVYQPVWFDSVGEGVTVHARYGEGDFFLAGWWRGNEVAAGKPAIVSGSHGNGRVVYMGFQPVFRAHPEFTFRLLANSITFVAP